MAIKRTFVDKVKASGSKTPTPTMVQGTLNNSSLKNLRPDVRENPVRTVNAESAKTLRGTQLPQGMQLPITIGPLQRNRNNGQTGLFQPKENDPYLEGQAAYEKMLQSNAAALKAELEKVYGEMIGGINTGYDRSANNAYVQYRQGQKALPEQLSQYGLNGGASESANLKLQAAYGTNLANNEYNRNSALSDVRQDKISRYADIDANTNSAIAEAYLQNMNNSIAWKQDQQDRADVKAKEAEAKALQKEVDNWNNKVMANVLKRTAQGYEVETWTESNGKLHYRIVGNNKKAAKAQYEAAQALLNQSMALADAGYSVSLKDGGLITTSKKNLTSGNSSGGGSGSGSSRGLAPAKNTKNTSNKGKTKKADDLNYGKVLLYTKTNASKMISDPYSVVKDLKSKIKSGYFTEAEANAVYAKMPSLKK